MKCNLGCRIVSLPWPTSVFLVFWFTTHTRWAVGWNSLVIAHAKLFAVLVKDDHHVSLFTTSNLFWISTLFWWNRSFLFSQFLHLFLKKALGEIWFLFWEWFSKFNLSSNVLEFLECSGFQVGMKMVSKITVVSFWEMSLIFED